jgi:hypothetical protein
MISIKLHDKAFGVPALAGILKIVILDGDPKELRRLGRLILKLKLNT